MIGGFRAGGFAAALMMLVTFFAAPAAAAASEAAASVPKVTFQAPVAAQVDSTVIAAPQQQMLAAPQRRPLRDLIISFVDYGMQDAEHECLVKAIYFEARSESAEGQLAVAEVILNRAASGIYPPTICGVVTQAAQFSFIRAGKFPVPDTNSAAWRQALAIADVARKGLADAVPANVLWYHATYVAPSWGRRLTRVAQIGTHIFYS
jgi:spore germination cell wall hydrolase CwlJ-like protein